MEETLRKWNKAKEQLAYLEGKIEKYKGLVSAEMTRKGTTTISAGDITVTKRSGKRMYLSKDNVPIEVWNRYATQSFYESYYIGKKSFNPVKKRTRKTD